MSVRKDSATASRAPAAPKPASAWPTRAPARTRATIEPLRGRSASCRGAGIACLAIRSLARWLHPPVDWAPQRRRSRGSIQRPAFRCRRRNRGARTGFDADGRFLNSTPLRMRTQTGGEASISCASTSRFGSVAVTTTSRTKSHRQAAT